MQGWGRRVAVAAVAGVAALGVGGCLRPATPQAAPASTGTGTTMPTTTATSVATTPATTTATPPTTGGPSTLSAAATWSAFAVAPDAWKDWKPVLSGVRPATDADLAALTERAGSVQARSYTARAVGLFGGELELTQSQDRTRVRFGDGKDPFLEVHQARPEAPSTALESLFDGPSTVCFHQERGCVALSGNEKPRDKPHLFDNLTDVMLAQATAVTTTQLAPATLAEARDEGAATGVATVESPIGRLDCVLLVESVGALNDLEGATLDPTSHERDLAGLCVDARGLVVFSPGAVLLPLTPYLSLQPSVQPGFDTLPFPVRPYPS